MGLTDKHLDLQGGTTIEAFANTGDANDMDHPLWNGPDSPQDERRMLAERARKLLAGNLQ